MDGYNFTERVRVTLTFAREEAARLNHEYVGTEHIVLGLIREGAGVGSAVLSNLKVNAADVVAKIHEVVKTGKNHTGNTDLPYTSRAKKVLELAMTEARDLGHNYVGTEHVLLGLIREEKGIGAQVLASFGVTLELARPEVIRTIGDTPRKPVDKQDWMMNYVTVTHTMPGANLLLRVSAAFAIVIGLLLIFNARAFNAPMGIEVDDWTETIAQLQGAVLLGLGLINWLSRDVQDRAALWAIYYGNFVVQAVSFAIVARALARGLIPAAGFGAMALHIILGAAFAWHLVKLRRAST